MSFTTDVKKEIIGKAASFASAACKRAALSAFVRTSGALGVQNGTPAFFLVSETEYVAEFFMRLYAELFSSELIVTHAAMDKMSGRDKLVLLADAETSLVALGVLGLIKRGGGDIREGISRTLVKDDERKIAYVKGAFLGGGSCTLPKSGGAAGYHLEIVFSERKTAYDFCGILDGLGLFAKYIKRKETHVVYMKSKEAISDFLAVIGAESSLKKLNATIEKRDESNNDNRARNCMAGNADKTAIAAVKQVVAIQNLQEKTHFRDLSEELKTLAKTRLQYPTMSLKELAEKLGVSKSCLNHRMRRLLELSEEV